MSNQSATPGTDWWSSYRRAAGILTVVLALVCAVALSRIGGNRTAGIAAAPRGATLPSVGDCLESLTDPLSAPAIVDGSFEVNSYDEASVTFSHCTGPHIGEIVAFLMTPGAPAAIDLPTVGSGGAPDSAMWCRLIADQYAGATMWRFRTNDDSGWEPSTGQRFIAVGGAITGDPAGSRWATCAVVAAGLEPYEGSYLRSWADDAAPPPFGRCRSGWAVDNWVSCTAPHRTQEFGTRPEAAAADRTGLAGCRSLIEVMTGMSDVTRGGALEVDVSTENSTSSCRLSVTGDRPLVGTLVGIGDRPLPTS